MAFTWRDLKVYQLHTSFKTGQNPVGMVNIVAEDFNPRVLLSPFLLNPVGMNHIIGFYMHHPYGIHKKSVVIHRRIEIRRYNIDHPYGILDKKDVCN
jgi:hypothetical protein